MRLERELPRNNVESSYERAVSRDTRELLRIDPLRISVEYAPPSRLLDHVVGGVIDSAKEHIDGAVVKKDTDANALFFPVWPGNETWGLMRHKKAFEKGASGVMITTVPEPIDHESLLRTSRVFLANVPSQYGLIAVGNPSSTGIRGVYVLSMEGARPYVDFEVVGEEAGFREVAERLTRLPGGRHNTNTKKEYSQDALTQADLGAIEEMIHAGNRLQALGLIPHVGLDDYVRGVRGRAIKAFLGVSGLSEANFSMLHNDYVWMTQSGMNKGDLRPKGGTVRIKGVNPDLDGVRVLLSNGESFTKTSVESVDNFYLYAARAGVKSGKLKSTDLQEFINYVSDEESVSGDLQALGKEESPPSLIHIHKWIEEGSYDPELFSVTDVDPKLVPNQAMHSSCGTHPLALYSAAAGLEAELREKQEGRDRIKILLMPNHGLQIASRFSLRDTIKKLEEAMASGAFKPSPVPPR